MDIKELLSKIREDIESLSVDDQQDTLVFLKSTLRKIHDQSFKVLTADEFELAITVLKAIEDGKTDLFTQALTTVARELAKQEEGEAPKKPSDDWASLGSESTLEELYNTFLETNKRLRTEEIFKKIDGYRFENLTSHEFDFVQKHCDSRFNNTLKQLLTQAYNTAKEDAENEADLPSLEDCLSDWNTNLFNAAYKRLQLDRIIDEEQLITERSIPTFRLSDPKQFFDLLFHQYSPSENSPYAAKTPLRDHRALFIALVSAAKSTINETDHDAFFKSGRKALARLYNLSSDMGPAGDDIPGGELKGAPNEADIPYAMVYYVIFGNDTNDAPMIQAIIETLKKYDATDKSYQDARAEFLRTYDPEQFSSSASSSSLTEEHRQSSAVTASTSSSFVPETSVSEQPEHNESTQESSFTASTTPLTDEKTPQTETAQEPMNTASPASTPRNTEAKEEQFTEEHSSSNSNSNFEFDNTQFTTNQRSTTITATTTSSTHHITKEMILEHLWGGSQNDNPTTDSVCEKILAKWNEKYSPAMFPPPEFMFVKPTLKDVKVEDDGKNIEINLTVKHQAREEIKLNLSRQVNEKKNQETWICQSSDDLISETKQFELIATELFALRKAQGIENAESIGIMSIGEKEDDKKESTQFCCTNDKTVRLSSREEALIEAHIEAGFTVTYGQYEIKKSGSATLNFTI